VFTKHQRKARILFGLSDILVTIAAFEAAYQTRLFLPLSHNFYFTVAVKALLLGAASLAWVALGYWLMVYDRLDSALPHVILRDTFKQCALGTATLILLEYTLRLDVSRTFIGLFALYSWVLLCVFRLRAGKIVGLIRREFGAPHEVMVVGDGESALRLGAQLEQAYKYGIRLRGFLNEDPAPEARSIQLSKAYPVYPLSELSGLVQRVVIDEIIFAVGSHRLAELEEVFLMCDEEGIRTRVVVDFFPHVNSDVYLERLGVSPLLTFSAAPHDEIRLFLKRSIDFILAASALVLLTPFILAVVILIRLTSPGPAIFRQVRCGLNGRRFTFYKFRSMCQNAEELKPALLHLNKKSTAFKIPNDPRLTAVGRWLRKFSVDELPQLWNVLRGDMSLVGPRPAVPEEVEQYKRWQRRRLRMRPGLTCLWALRGRDSLDFETWMKLDMEYIDNWSLSLDWRIILGTIPRVLTGKGAH
jgi:exopolysaccharide biosynthesis polyprenyl glycosylphosphotransferase